MTAGWSARVLDAFSRELALGLGNLLPRLALSFPHTTSARSGRTAVSRWLSSAVTVQLTGHLCRHNQRSWRKCATFSDVT